MTRFVDIIEAKKDLAELVDQVREDGEVIITRAGRPVARLVAYKKLSRRKLGALEGRSTIRDDFDAPLPEEEHAMFDGDDWSRS